MQAPPRLRAPGLPGVNPGSQGVIPRRFKQKKKICDGWTDGLTNGRMDRLDGENSDLEMWSKFVFVRTITPHRGLSKIFSSSASKR